MRLLLLPMTSFLCSDLGGIGNDFWGRVEVYLRDHLPLPIDIDEMDLEPLRDKHGDDRTDDVIGFIETITENTTTITKNTTGGFDLAEEHVDISHRCGSCDHPSDLTATIKSMILFTDALAHSISPQSCTKC